MASLAHGQHYPETMVRQLYSELSRRQEMTHLLEPTLADVSRDMVTRNQKDIVFLKDLEGNVVAVSPRMAEFCGERGLAGTIEKIPSIWKSYDEQHRLHDEWCIRTRRPFLGWENWKDPRTGNEEEALVIKIPNIERGVVTGIIVLVPEGFMEGRHAGHRSGTW